VSGDRAARKGGVVDVSAGARGDFVGVNAGVRGVRGQRDIGPWAQTGAGAGVDAWVGV
jgi:hypothetical protein